MDARHTAAAIARIREREGSRPENERLFDDPHAGLFDDASLDVQQLFELVPFFEEHIRLRTRFIDDIVREAVAGGARFVVLLGAGFDTRGLRMPELRGAVRVVEVDHEDQITSKKQRFADANVTLPDNLSFAAADLMTPGALAAALADAGLREAHRALWICEGLFGYLSLAAITEIATTTRRLSLPGSTLVANHGIRAWSPEALAQTFTAAGFRVLPPPSYDELHRRWLGPDVKPGWEEFALMVARL
jgi:methyltransferase (TIGR00027 family)